MSDNQDLIDDESKIRLPNRAKLIAIVWIIFCIAIFFFWLNASPENTVHSLSLGDIGAFLSGIFSILALYGFIEAYLIQSQELRLQRLELQESIKAQQGSEIALKEQSEALQAQLKISAEQFNLYLLEAKAKTPVFTLFKICDCKVTLLDRSTYKSYEIPLPKKMSSPIDLAEKLYTVRYLNFSIHINNKGGGGRLIDVKNLTEIKNSCVSLENPSTAKNKENEIYDNYFIKFNIATYSEDNYLSERDSNLKEFILNIIESIKFETTFRSHERYYKQKYQVCRANILDEYLQPSSSLPHNFEKIDFQKLFQFGYTIEIFE